MQWHLENATGATIGDADAFRVCVAAAGSRHRAGLTVLGTEDLGRVAPRATQQFSGECTNRAASAITLVSLDPHMHRAGTRATVEIERGGGSIETVLDEPFTFDDRSHYDFSPRPLLQPGDTVRATCSMHNTSAVDLAFGLSSHQEMCYQFVLAFPPRALGDGVTSLIGVNNTCW